MTVGELKKQFERIGVNDATKLYLVNVNATWPGTEYEPICVYGFQQKGVGIFFYGSDGEEINYNDHR